MLFVMTAPGFIKSIYCLDCAFIYFTDVTLTLRSDIFSSTGLHFCTCNDDKLSGAMFDLLSWYPLQKNINSGLSWYRFKTRGTRTSIAI